MSQILEIKSKSIEDAITNALEQLSVSREDIEVEVIENPVTVAFLPNLSAIKPERNVIGA